MVGLSGLEPPTSRLSGECSNRLSYKPILVIIGSSITFATGGDKRDRTVDPLLAKQVLSQLSYTPVRSDSAVNSRFVRFFPNSFELSVRSRNLLSFLFRTLKIKQRFRLPCNSDLGL